MSTPDPLPRRTGLHKLDLFVGACALLVSAVSLVIGWQANRTQQRMLAATVWPYLAWDTSNYNDDTRQDEVSLEIRNVGVGPAHIESLQLSYQGKPLADFHELVAACCKAEVEGLRHWSSRISTINPVVIPAQPRCGTSSTASATRCRAAPATARCWTNAGCSTRPGRNPRRCAAARRWPGSSTTREYSFSPG
jgi:hypothetical protein